MEGGPACRGDAPGIAAEMRPAGPAEATAPENGGRGKRIAAESPVPREGKAPKKQRLLMN